MREAPRTMEKGFCVINYRKRRHEYSWQLNLSLTYQELKTFVHIYSSIHLVVFLLYILPGQLCLYRQHFLKQLLAFFFIFVFIEECLLYNTSIRYFCDAKVVLRNTGTKRFCSVWVGWLFCVKRTPETISQREGERKKNYRRQKKQQPQPHLL